MKLGKVTLVTRKMGFGFLLLKVPVPTAKAAS